jgi:hypothetical protein
VTFGAINYVKCDILMIYCLYVWCLNSSEILGSGNCCQVGLYRVTIA